MKIHRVQGRKQMYQWGIKAGNSASSAQKNITLGYYSWLQARLCHKMRLVSSSWAFHFITLSLHPLFPPPMSIPAHPLSVQFSFLSTISGIFWKVSKDIFCSEINFGSKRGKNHQKIHFLLHMMVLKTHQQPPSCCDLRNSAVFVA